MTGQRQEEKSERVCFEEREREREREREGDGFGKFSQ